MKRIAFILIPGLALALAGYFCLYFATTAQSRSMMHCPEPELAWLREEFKMSDAEFVRVSQLHEAYRPRCQENCRAIARNNEEIKALLEQTNVVTPEIEHKLAEATQIRLGCQKMMLDHFLAVSKTMPPEQGRKYLDWVEERTFQSHASMKGMECRRDEY